MCPAITIEPVSRLADLPLMRCICVHGHSWWVTEDGQPAPPPEGRKPPRLFERLEQTGTCAWCHKALPPADGHHGNRRYCEPPEPCASRAKRERERVSRLANARATA